MRAVFALLLFATHDAAALLRPQAAESRSLSSLDGAWRVQIDAAGVGAAQRWQSAPLRNVSSAPVPSTLNDVLELDGYFGAVWYERTVFRPPGGGASAVYFEHATANAEVWLNGERLGSHRGVGLPFGWPVALGAGQNRLTVRVDGERNWQDLPPGATTMSKYVLFYLRSSVLSPPCSPPC